MFSDHACAIWQIKNNTFICVKYERNLRTIEITQILRVKCQDNEIHGLHLKTTWNALLVKFFGNWELYLSLSTSMISSQVSKYNCIWDKDGCRDTHAIWGRSMNVCHGFQMFLTAQNSTIEDNWVSPAKYKASYSVDTLILTDGCLANAKLQNGF